MDPATFSALVNDIVPIKAGDPRVLRIAAVLGVPASEAFTEIADKPKVAKRSRADRATRR